MRNRIEDLILLIILIVCLIAMFFMWNKQGELNENRRNNICNEQFRSI